MGLGGNQQLPNYPPPEEGAEGIMNDNIIFLCQQNPQQIWQHGNISQVLVVGFFPGLFCMLEQDREFSGLLK